MKNTYFLSTNQFLQLNFARPGRISTIGIMFIRLIQSGNMIYRNFKIATKMHKIHKLIFFVLLLCFFVANDLNSLP